MNKYLLEFLKETNTVIIPNLGALTVTNVKTGEIMFMPFLKHDDGKLANFIAEKEGSELQDVKNQIAKYVQEILAQLDKGEKYDIFNLGTLSKEQDGDIQFDATIGTETEITEAEHLEIEKEPAVPETKEESAVSKGLEHSAESTLVDKNETEEKQAEEEMKTSDSAEIKSTKISSEEVKKEKVKAKIEDKKVIPIKVQKTKKEPKIRKQTSAIVTPKKRNNRLVTLLIIVGLLSLGMIYVGMNFANIKESIPFLSKEKKELTGPEKKEIPQAVKEPLKKESLKKEEKNNPVSTPKSNTEKEMSKSASDPVQKPLAADVNFSTDLTFHVIVGAFSSEENANRFAQKIQSQGHTTKVGRGNGLYLVSAKSFGSKSEAEAAVQEFKSVSSHPWVYEWR